MRAGPFCKEIYWLKCRFAKDKIQKRGIVGLNDKEEYLFKRDVEEFWSNDDVARVAPNISADEVGVPWYGCNNCDLLTLVADLPPQIP